MRRAHGALAVLASVAVLLYCAAGVSTASAEPTASFGYALAAVGFRSYFVFDAKPGEPLSGELRVTSLTPGTKTILLEPVDVSTAAAGGLQYGESSPVGDGRWLGLERSAVSVSGHESAEVPFTVHVARHTSGGEHFIGIVAIDRRALREVARGSGAIRLRLIPRLAMTIELRLPGRPVTGLGVGRAAIAVAPSGASLALAIDNPGNTLVDGTRGQLTVSENGRRLFASPVRLGPFVPRTAVGYELPWQGRPVQGTYRVAGELTPTGGRTVRFTRTVTFGAPAIRQFRRETGRPATLSSGPPALLIGLLALATFAAAVFASAYLRTRARLARQPGRTAAPIHLHPR